MRNRLLKIILPQSSCIYKFYAGRLLKFTRINTYMLFRIKLVIVFGVLALLLLVKYTNILMLTQKIYNDFEYKSDLIYQNVETADKQLAFVQELRYLLQVKDRVKAKELFASYQSALDIIFSSIDESEILIIPKKVLASRIYYRLYDYYRIRQTNILLYLLFSMLFSFVPELIIFMYNVFIRSERKRELKFLKKLMILNGSIKPADFIEVLKLLIGKSKYYALVLKEIENKNRSNSSDNFDIYMPYIRKSRSIEEKLFFEKLDEANNYDFDQAICNIRNEFSLEKREVGRNIRKRIEQLHVAGLLGLMTIVLVLTLYLIIPWTSMYNINQLIY